MNYKFINYFENEFFSKKDILSELNYVNASAFGFFNKHKSC